MALPAKNPKIKSRKKTNDKRDNKEQKRRQRKTFTPKQKPRK